MKNQGILLLSHCGFSYVEDLIKIACDLGLESYVISSQPLINKVDRAKRLAAISDEINFSEGNQLEYKDIIYAVDLLQKKGKKIIGCVSVWEGYREFMAEINAKLGANDIDLSCVQILRNKFELRKKLGLAKLSKVKTEVLNEINFEQYKKSKIKKFIKPKIGIASYATFSLKKETTWKDICIINDKVEDDIEYSSIFKKSLEFIIEDYIYGKEYSFEIIVLDSIPYIIAIHEKIEVEEQRSTVLEAACVSSPLTLSKNAINNAELWIDSVFKTLSIATGCYHVEAKLNNKTWEIIEINPRIGGAFINQSVEQLTDGSNMLAFWMKALTLKIPAEIENFHIELNALSTKSENFFSRSYRTFFRVYFAKLIGTIKNIKTNDVWRAPDIVKIFLKPGVELQSESREIFVGQALWKLGVDEINTLNQLISESKKYLEVEYEK